MHPQVKVEKRLPSTDKNDKVVTVLLRKHQLAMAARPGMEMGADLVSLKFVKV